MGNTAEERETDGRTVFSSRRAFLEQLLCGACATSAHRATDLAPFLPCDPPGPEPPPKPRVRVNNGTPQVPELPPVVRIPLRCHVSTRAWWDAAGKRLLFGTEEGDVAELDVRTRRVRALFRAPFPLIKDDSVAVSPRGTRVATPGRDGVVEIRDTRRGALISTLRGQKEEVQRLVWSPDARYLVTTSFNSCRVWDVRRRQQLAAFDRLAPASGIAWSPDGTRIALAQHLGQVLVLRAPGAEILRPMRSPPLNDGGWPHPVAWNRLGTRVVCSGLVIPEIEVYQAADGRLLQTLDGFVGQVAGLVWNPRRDYLAAVGMLARVSLWKPNSGQRIAVIDPQEYIFHAAWHPDGKLLATIGTSVVHLWDLDQILRAWKPQPEAGGRPGGER